MNVEKMIASLPDKTAEQRQTMRGNAEAKLAAGDPAWATAAAKMIEAIDGFDHERTRLAGERRASAIADVGGAPLVECIVTPFEFEPPTQAEEKLIQILLDHPGSTCAELSAHHGWEPIAWDLQYGAMCASRVDFLWPLEPSVRNGEQANINMLTGQERGPDGVLRYCNRPEAVEAFRALGFRVRAS